MISLHLAFLLLAFVTLVSACAVVLFKNPIYCALSLIVCFLTISFHYLMLHAPFLAVVHVVVYAGAIMVLFLFIMMLMNLNSMSGLKQKKWIRLGAGLFLIGWLFLAGISVSRACVIPVFGKVFSLQTMAHVLFTDYAVPFEFTSILFLSVIVGAVMIGKKS